MLRTRKPFPVDKLDQLRQLCDEDFTRDRESQFSDWYQTDAGLKTKQLIREYLSQYNVDAVNIIVHDLLYAPEHTDNLCKTVFVFVVQGSEDAVLFEGNHKRQLLTGCVFTLNDFIEHGIYHKDNVDKEEYDQLVLVTADTANY